MKEKLMALLSEGDKKSLKKILVWGLLSAVSKALPYMFIILDKATGRQRNRQKDVDHLLRNDGNILYHYVSFQYEVLDYNFTRCCFYRKKR